MFSVGSADNSWLGGSITVSMMCATPLVAKLSAAATVASSLEPTLTNVLSPSGSARTWSFLPSTVATCWYTFKSVDSTWAGSTWYVKMSTSWSLFSGLSKVSTVPSGRAPKASLVGANTVNGPGELRVSARSPATTAATKVDKLSTDWANSTMFTVGSSDNSSKAGGSITASMMWATPFVAKLSAPTTVASNLCPTRTPFLSATTLIFFPSTVVTRWKGFKSVDNTCAGS